MSPLYEDFAHLVAVVSQAVVGLFFMLAGAAWFAFTITRTSFQTGHLIAAGSVCVFGAAVLPSVGPFVMRALKGVASVVLSFLPARPNKAGE